MQQDFQSGIIWGRALSDIRHLQDGQHDHEHRITKLEAWRSGAETPTRATDPRLAPRIALVTALWTAAASTAWHADSIAARLVGWIGR